MCFRQSRNIWVHKKALYCRYVLGFSASSKEPFTKKLSGWWQQLGCKASRNYAINVNCIVNAFPYALTSTG